MFLIHHHTGVLKSGCKGTALFAKKQICAEIFERYLEVNIYLEIVAVVILSATCLLFSCAWLVVVARLELALVRSDEPYSLLKAGCELLKVFFI